MVSCPLVEVWIPLLNFKEKGQLSLLHFLPYLTKIDIINRNEPIKNVIIYFKFIGHSFTLDNAFRIDA